MISVKNRNKPSKRTKKEWKAKKGPLLVMDGFGMPEVFDINRNHGGTKNLLNQGN